MVNKKTLTMFFLFFLFFALHVYFLITGSHSPLVYADEAGYIGNARYILFDQMGRSNYYPGYSYTLVPILFISNNIEIAYKLIQIWNSILLSLVPVLLFCLAPYIDKTITYKKRITASIVVALYPPFLLYSNLAMAESLFIVLFLVLTLQIACFSVHPENKIFWVSIPCNYIYLFLTHPRAIAVLPVLVATLLLILYPQLQARRGKYVAGRITLYALFAGFLLCLSVIFFLVFTESGYRVSEKFFELFTLTGFLSILKTYLSQLYYIVLSTYGLFAFGLSWTIYYLFKTFKNSKWDENENIVPLVFFVSCSLFMGILISAWFMKNGPRGDHIIYGRYNEGFLAPFLLLGVLSVLNAQFLKNNRLKVTVGTIILISTVYFLNAEPLNERLFNQMNIFGIYLYNFFLVDFNFILVSLIFLILFFTYLLVSFFSKYIAVIMVCIFFAITAVYANHNYFATGWKARSNSTEISSLITQVNDTQVAQVNPLIISFDVINFYGYFWYRYDQIVRNPQIKIDRFNSRTEDRHNLGSDLIVSQRLDLHNDFPGARIVALENHAPLRLWVMPGNIQDYFARKGHVLPLGFPCKLNRKAFSSSINVDFPSGTFWSKDQDMFFSATVTHAGEASFWPAVSGLMDINHSVRLGVRIIQIDNLDKTVFETRVDLPRSLYPGESAFLNVQIPASTVSGLEQGNYILALEMLQEFSTWFPEYGDQGSYYFLESNDNRIHINGKLEKQPKLSYNFNFLSPGMLIAYQNYIREPMHELYNHNLFSFIGCWTANGHGKIKNINLQVPPFPNYFMLETMGFRGDKDANEIHLKVIVNNTYDLEFIQRYENKYVFSLPDIKSIYAVDILSKPFVPIDQYKVPKLIGLSQDSNLRHAHLINTFFQKYELNIDANKYGVDIKEIRIVPAIGDYLKSMQYNIIPRDIPQKIEGFYDDYVWTNGNAIISGLDIKFLSPFNCLTLCTKGWRPSDSDKFEINVLLNNEHLIDFLGKAENLYYFQLPKNIPGIESIQIISSTFIPMESGVNNHDARKLGIDIDKIILTNQCPGNNS